MIAVWMKRVAAEKKTFLEAEVRRAIEAEDPRCIVWPFSRWGAGYGRLWDGEKYLRVSRVALEMKLGRPLHQLALHDCDNPSCFNPNHLREGTHAQNMRDARERQRFPKGEAHPERKLNDKIIRAIRADPQDGIVLARQYGVSNTLISRIRQRKTWAHLQ